MRTRLFTVAATLPLVLAPAAPAQAAQLLPSGHDVYECRGLGGFLATNPRADVEQDRFTWGPYKRVKVGNGRHDVNWKMDPYRQDSWRTWLNGMTWAASLVTAAVRGPEKTRDPGALDGALALAKDWIHDNPYPWPTGAGAGNATHTRTDFLNCVRSALQQTGRPVPAWLNTSLLQHAAWLQKNTWPDHNVGTDQTLAVLGVGCTLGRADLKAYAANRLSGEITRVIDAQGANNEQAIGYARFNYALWGYVENAFRTCGVNSAAARTISARRAGLSRFLDAATQPDGTLAMLGDTQVEATSETPAQQWLSTDGAAGAPGSVRVATYAAGYVFGRSGWGQGARKPSQESFYSLRFGPRRLGHGHNDHTSLTWMTKGRPILVDAGTGSYNNDAWRDYYTGPTAHNELVAAGMKTSEATTLVRSKVSAGGDFYELRDRPLPGLTRTRDVIALSDPDVMLVLDRATSAKATTFTQLWHLPHDETLRASGATASATAGGVTTTLVSLPGAGAAASAFGQVRGARKRIQGWQYTDYFHPFAAPVATVTRTGKTASIVTAIVASKAGEKVSVTAKAAGARTVYTVTVGATTATVTLAPDGTLTRTR